MDGIDVAYLHVDYRVTRLKPLLLLLFFGVMVVAMSLVCGLSVVGAGMVLVTAWQRCLLVVSRLSKKHK